MKIIEELECEGLIFKDSRKNIESSTMKDIFMENFRQMQRVLDF